MAIKQYNGTITKITNLSENIKHFTIKLDQEIEFKAGQFINLTFEDNNEEYTRAYSICSTPSNKTQIELCIKLIKDGRVTPYLFKKKEKDQVKIKGPFGLFTLEKLNKDKLVFIGTGTGIAPLKSMILNLIENNNQKEITLIFGIRFENEIIFQKEFEQLEKENPNFKFIPVVSKPTENWHGRTTYVQNNIDAIDILNSEIYICGNPKMVEETKQKLIQKGISEELIHNEKY